MDLKKYREALERVMDPEVPVISVTDLGIVREITVDGRSVKVKVTPTYSGCPATEVIARSIEQALLNAGAEQVTIETVYSPAWTTDWLSDAAKAKLKAYGIAPPEGKADGDLVQIRSSVRCPFCDSTRTKLESQFGSTACKALYSCTDCRQPFEYFKAF